MEYLAHIADDGREQTAQAHCRKAAEYAAAALRQVQLACLAALAGLLHDMGKFKEAYRLYLRLAAAGDPAAVRGSVNHTFAAVRFLLQRYHKQGGDPIRNLTAELLACAVGAHHGLFDCIDDRRRCGFLHRLEQEDIDYEESLTNYLAQCADLEELDALFAQAAAEVGRCMEKLQPLVQDEYGVEGDFYFGLLMRLLLSAVIEGDRRDTAEFMNHMTYPAFADGEARAAMWDTLLARMEQKLGEFSCDTDIARARRQISEQCRAFAAQPGGIYRLNVPTGAGKTLSSLRYALAHAKIWNRSRIIFTSPLLSILEQNAQVIRKYVGDDRLILEHHSNVIHTKETAERLDELELLAESWNCPIILTTLVQLLNTLFSGKTTCIRRFQALCNSVVVIDEVQTVPNNLLTLFDLAINFLVTVCGATVVLCSATQPCLEAAAHPLQNADRQIVPYDTALWSAFRRTQIIDSGSRRLDEIPEFVLQVLEDADSLLIVCNRKDEAERLYRALRAGPYRCFHLSAAMCIAHRRQTLQALQNALYALNAPGADHEKVICISTQVIEAGVDISFARVIRLAAGMDSIVQAAGRCNRSGDCPTPAPVHIVQCADENLGHLCEIQMAKDASLQLLEAFRQQPEQYGNDLTSDAAIRYYYRRLYAAMAKGYQDDTVQLNGKYVTLYSLLSDNRDFADADCPASGRYLLQQAFRIAGAKFEVFDGETTDVIVPYEEGQQIILELGQIDPQRDPAKLYALLERAKPYTVSLYSWQRTKLEKEAHALIPKCGGSILVLQEGYYDENTGLVPEAGQMDYMEV